jgi:hypothetical protein
MALARAFAGYSRVTVAMTSNIDVSAASLATLWPRVHQVVTVSEEESRRLAQGLGVPAALITVDRSRPRSSEANDDGSLITPAGPPEWEWSEQPRRFASLTARKLLGRRAPGVRATLISLMSTVRRRLTGIVPGPERPSETE